MITRLPFAVIAGPLGALHETGATARRRPNKAITRALLVRAIRRATISFFIIRLLLSPPIGRHCERKVAGVAPFA
jgi:hypothetical protein